MGLMGVSFAASADGGFVFDVEVDASAETVVRSSGLETENNDSSRLGLWDPRV